MFNFKIQSQIENCVICNNEFDIHKHLDGLVVDDKHFFCSGCCINTDKLMLMNLIKQKSSRQNSVRPISRWVVGK